MTVSDTVVLTPRAPLDRPIEAECIAPDRFAALGEREIAELPVWEGRRQLRLGDVVAVRGGRAARVVLEGDASKLEAIGAGMAGGELVVAGAAGRYVGTRMAGGTLHVEGSAGDGAGLEMAGGALVIDGDAGERLGASRLGASKGMLGGEIVVRGAAGPEAGAAARRGLIVIGGDAGEHAGHRMVAGTVIVLGSAARGAGEWSKRGSVVVMGDVSPAVTYRYACTYRPPHLAVTLLHLRRRYGLALDERWVHGRYRRYSGDLAELGKGEILQWATE